MEADLIPYPHTEASFEVRQCMWEFLVEAFDVIIHNLRSEIVGYRRIRIEALHRVILYCGFDRGWQSVSDIQRFYDGWVREHYAHFFSTARHSQVENDRSSLVFSDDVPAGQSASVHRMSGNIVETSPTILPHTPSNFEVRQAIWASLTAIFDIIIEHPHSVFEEDPESRIERIDRAILDNGTHRCWDSVADMYRIYEGCIQDLYPHLFSRGHMADDDCQPGDHSVAFAVEAMMRDVPTTQSIGNTLREDTAGHSTEQPSADAPNEDAGMSLSSNARSFAQENDVTPVASIDALGPHPESYSPGDEVHSRPGSDEERDHVLRMGRWATNDPEGQTLYDRNQRLLFRIHELMGIGRSSWRTEDSDTPTPQEGRNDSNTPVRIAQETPSMISMVPVRPEGDSETSSSGEGGAGWGGRGDLGGPGSYLTSETLTSVGGHAEPQDSESWIDDFATPSYPSFRGSVPLRPPPAVPRRRRAFPRRRHAQPPPDAPTRQETSAYNREMRLRGTPVQHRVRRVPPPSWWNPHVETGALRRDEEPRFAGATGQRQIDTFETPCGRKSLENSSLFLSVEC